MQAQSSNAFAVPCRSICPRFLLLLLTVLFLSPGLQVRGQVLEAVEFDGGIYVSLDALVSPRVLGGTYALTERSSVIEARLGGRRIVFENGGDRIRRDLGPAKLLQRPLLVLGGKYFIPAGECAPHFGYQFQEAPEPSLTLGDRQLSLSLTSADSKFRRHEVDLLEPVHRPLTLLRPLRVRASLLPGIDPGFLAEGSRIIAIRKVQLNSAPWYLIVDTGPTLGTYLVEAGELDRATQARLESPSCFESAKDQLLERAYFDEALRHGPREELHSTVALTVDLCWSLRPYEEQFFDALPKMTLERGGRIWPVLFVSGRWIEQHPLEMESLIILSRQPGVTLLWGNHSYAHPKSGEFMKDFSPEEVREDTLRVENLLLEYGIVPSVYYRFPGLVHDRARLEAVLGLDLLPVDCDAWLACSHSGRAPFCLPPTHGSIILIHGNGNEPRGIEKFFEWQAENAPWRFGPLPAFLIEDYRVEMQR